MGGDHGENPIEEGSASLPWKIELRGIRSATGRNRCGPKREIPRSQGGTRSTKGKGEQSWPEHRAIEEGGCRRETKGYFICQGKRNLRTTLWCHTISLAEGGRGQVKLGGSSKEGDGTGIEKNIGEDDCNPNRTESKGEMMSRAGIYTSAGDYQRRKRDGNKWLWAIQTPQRKVRMR